MQGYNFTLVKVTDLRDDVVLPCCILAIQASDAVERPSWRASIDFKWIRENKDAIAANIVHRKSGGDVEAVVQLYEQSVQLSQAGSFFLPV